MRSIFQLPPQAEMHPQSPSVFDGRLFRWRLACDAINLQAIEQLIKLLSWYTLHLTVYLSSCMVSCVHRQQWTTVLHMALFSPLPSRDFAFVLMSWLPHWAGKVFWMQPVNQGQLCFPQWYRCFSLYYNIIWNGAHLIMFSSQHSSELFWKTGCMRTSSQQPHFTIFQICCLVGVALYNYILTCKNIKQCICSVYIWFV